MAGTTVLGELSRRGHLTVDTDYDGWQLPDGTWDERRVDQLLARQPVLLSAPLRVLMERVRRRTNNPYGNTPDQRAEIAQYLQTVEPLLRRGATLELDGQLPVPELADTIERLVTRGAS